MKVLILGASGIIAQHMRLCIPPGIKPFWVRHTQDPITRGVDLRTEDQPEKLLDEITPDVIVNLAGISNVDDVERGHPDSERINVALPGRLALWSQRNARRLIQISSQAVHSGDSAPYGPVVVELLDPVNQYGVQKAIAEHFCASLGAVVMRLTFILGIRPLPHVGRENPLEAILRGQSPQVNNRWFSPLMARDAAELIWREVTEPTGEPIIQCGIPEAWSRYQIAMTMNHDVAFCRHEDFKDLAPRPFNATYRGSRSLSELRAGIMVAQLYASRDRAIELALFFGTPVAETAKILDRGFGPLHNDVTASFNRAAPADDNELIGWYRETQAYIWELSAYHEDPGFNYAGMCSGIVTRLKNEGARRVLCLGDGIGDLTLAMIRAGLKPVYHDLAGSRTAEYALFRIWRQTGQYPAHHMSVDWDPPTLIAPYDAVVSLDFLEHVTDVECWVRAAHAALKPGGLFCAQNAFACGSGPDGAMPMHLAVNDRFEKDWDPLLTAVGFEQLSSNWYRKI